MAMRLSRLTKRPGKSVKRSAATSPRNPLVLATRATKIKSSELFDDIEHVATMMFQPDRINQRPQRAHGPALFANHLSYVRLRDSYFDPRCAVPLDLAHVNCIRVIDQGL